jgi:hypothetical protein
MRLSKRAASADNLRELNAAFKEARKVAPSRQSVDYLEALSGAAGSAGFELRSIAATAAELAVDILPAPARGSGWERHRMAGVTAAAIKRTCD